jgi:hypothetical protein
MINKSCVVLAVLCSLVLLPAASQGQIITYNFPLDAGQAANGAGTASSGSGTGVVNLNTSTNSIDWTISWSGLTGPATAGHFHGPAAAGAGGPPTVFLTGTTSPDIGAASITAAQVADIQAGLWYVNIHTNVFPGGEIRGQVVPEPLTLSLLGLGSAVLIRRRQRRIR